MTEETSAAFTHNAAREEGGPQGDWDREYTHSVNDCIFRIVQKTQKKKKRKRKERKKKKKRKTSAFKSKWRKRNFKIATGHTLKNELITYVYMHRSVNFRGY